MLCTTAVAVVVIGLAVAGCTQGAAGTGGNDGKPPSAGPATVTDWYAQGGTTLTQQIAADLTAIGAAAPDTARMKPACAQLATDVSAARNYPRIPDGQAQQHWTAALNQLTATASACTAGDTATADADIQHASREMQALTARVNSLGGA
jgi:hypothetical protein